MFEKWRVKAQMDVIDAAGQHAGTVDGIEGEKIKLTRTDSVDGQHHFIPLDAVLKIDGNCVYLMPNITFVEPARATVPHSASAKADAPLFGTSGHGTGMGGAGTTSYI